MQTQDHNPLKNKNINVRVPPEYEEIIRQVAARESRTLSDQLRHWIKPHIEKEQQTAA